MCRQPNRATSEIWTQLWLEHRVAGPGSKYANHCALLTPLTKHPLVRHNIGRIRRVKTRRNCVTIAVAQFKAHKTIMSNIYIDTLCSEFYFLIEQATQFSVLLCACCAVVLKMFVSFSSVSFSKSSNRRLWKQIWHQMASGLLSNSHRLLGEWIKKNRLLLIVPNYSSSQSFEYSRLSWIHRDNLSQCNVIMIEKLL